MNLFSFLRPIRSAPVALERLHTVLEYDRCLIGQTDLIPVLHTDILAAISRYMTVDPDKLQVRIHSLADPVGMRRIGGTDDRVSGTPWRWVAAILVMSFVVIVALVVGYGRPGIVATNQGSAPSAATNSTERSASRTSETVPSAPSSAASPPSSAGPSSAPAVESRSSQANPIPSPAGSGSFSNAGSLNTTESGSSIAASPNLPNTTERGSSKTGSSSSSGASTTESNNTAALAQQTTLRLHSEQVAQSLQTQTQPPVTASSQNLADTQRISPDRLSTRQVRQIQQALDNMGFKAGWIDGKWGPKTEAALKSFQRSRNIASNGQLDQTTVSALGLNVADFGLTGSDATKNGQTPIRVGWAQIAGAL